MASEAEIVRFRDPAFRDSPVFFGISLNGVGGPAKAPRKVASKRFCASLSLNLSSGFLAMTDDYDELRKDVAIEIGNVVIEWNEFCEALGILFATIIFPSAAANKVALSIWHSTTNDRAQRDMLLAAAKATTEFFKTYPKFFSDVEYLWDRGNALADRRNSAVHAPTTFETDNAKGTTRFVTNTFFGHIRAHRIKDADLVKEFRKYADYAKKLTVFSRNVQAAIIFGPTVHPWPDRPSLPDLGRKNSRPDQLHQPIPK